MRFWKRAPPHKDTESEPDLRSPTFLDQFEIEFESPPSFLTRLKELCRKYKTTLNLSRQAKIYIIAILLDLGCAAYQAVDSYLKLFPGSKIAANILLNSHTTIAWDFFFWIIAIITSIFNFLAVIIWATWLNNRFAIEAKVERFLRSECLAALVFLFVRLAVLPALIIGPFWVTFALRWAWQAIAWNHECSGWDYTILLNGINWYIFGSNQTFVGTATILAAHGNLTMELFHDVLTKDVYTFNVTNSFNITPVFSSIMYNLTSLTYTIANVTTLFDMTPNLSFPTLNISMQDPSIPFLRTDPSYPPSADLVYRNGTAVSNLLSTYMLNFPGCTELKACGMQDQTGAFQIVLGVVMIEQFKAAVYCTVPSNETVRGL